MPEGISQRKGRTRIVKAIKSIKSKAEKDIIDAWLIWRRNLPKPLRPLITRSFNVSLIPNSSHLFIQLNEVFYLFLLLIIVYIAIAIYIWLSENSNVIDRRSLIGFYSIHYNPRA